MSSPFTSSCRCRSRSASSPSSSPVPFSSSRPAHKRAHSSHRDLPDPKRYHLDIWRTGKRARRDISPTQATRSSTPASTHSTTSSGSSAPHTPLFPASSTDFLLFSGRSVCSGNQTTRNRCSPSSAVSNNDTCEPSHSDLARLRSEAFSQLKRSVEENGEGFVKRMREFEVSRSKSVQYSRPRGFDRRRRKRYSPGIPSTRPTGKVTSSDDDDDDVLIFSSAFNGESFHPRQRRSSSLGAMDDNDLHGARSSSGRLSPISSIFYPFSFPLHASHIRPSTAGLSTSYSASFNTNLHTNAFKPTSSHSSSDSLTSSGDLSNLYAKVAHYPSSSLMVSPPQSPCQISASVIPTSASSAEKVIATLTLAMANGTGSLGDYEAVRTLSISSVDESQVGELWH